MASRGKLSQQLARRLFRLSLADGAVSPERAAGVLAWVEKHRPAGAVAVLRAYRRLVAAELARGQAAVEHAGPVSNESLQAIGAALTRKYGRPVVPGARPNPALLAGLRVRVGDDVYEASAAGQLAALAAAL